MGRPIVFWRMRQRIVQAPPGSRPRQRRLPRTTRPSSAERGAPCPRPTPARRQTIGDSHARGKNPTRLRAQSLNALKSGRYSAQVKAALHAMRREIRPPSSSPSSKSDAAKTIPLHALILATAKIIHNAELTPVVESTSSTNSSSSPARKYRARPARKNLDFKYSNRTAPGRASKRSPLSFHHRNPQTSTPQPCPLNRRPPAGSPKQPQGYRANSAHHRHHRPGRLLPRRTCFCAPDLQVLGIVRGQYLQPRGSIAFTSASHVTVPASDLHYDDVAIR